MTPETSRAAKLGLARLTDELPEKVRQARLLHGTNDVALVVFPRAGKKADVFSAVREIVLGEVKRDAPECPQTLARLQEVPPVTQAPAVVYADGGLFVMDVHLDFDRNMRTAGVLN